MRINLYADNFIHAWDYRDVFDTGIGGSETSQVEMAMRLAARGHDVTSYGPLPTSECSDCGPTYDADDSEIECKTCDGWVSVPSTPNQEFGGVHWRHFREANFHEPGLWIIYRSPQAGFRIGKERHPDARYWLLCQDVFYPDWKSEDVANFDRVIGLCPRHIADIIARDPANASRVCMSSNGINVERIEEAECDAPPRNHKRLIWASSPDRGLKECLDIFERALEQVPDLELHCFYGFNNIELICGGDRKKMPWRLSWEQYDRACAMPGVTWRGRIGQRELTREWLSSGLWVYPSWFAETSAIACMEAQACGCIPICNPIWACAANVKHGIFIEGQQSDPLVKARYVEWVARVANNPAGQEQIRGEMMRESRERLSWNRFADQWEGWMAEDFASQPETQELVACNR